MTAADRIPRPLPSGLFIVGYQAAICSWCGALVARGPLVVVGGEIEPWTLHAEWHTSPRRDGRTDSDSRPLRTSQSHETPLSGSGALGGTKNG